MAANLRICSAVAALALLTTPAASFMAAPPAHSMRATHVLQRGGRREAPSVVLPVQLRTLKATKMVGTTGGGGKDFTGEDGLFEFVGGGPAGASMFPMPGNDESWMSLSRVCVLLFNPRTENEGIYTLQLRVREGCVNTVVLFEEREDAERFAGLLEAQDFPAPQVEALDPREIAAFTANAGYKTSFIPSGTLFLPPEDNVGPNDRPWKPDDPTLEKKEKKLVQILADADDSDQVDYNKERQKLESLFGSL